MKRVKVFAERGLDLLDAPKVFESRSITVEDDRFAYGEVRWVTYGWMDDVAIALVWTERDDGRRVISMRRMHRWEIEHVGLD